MQTNTNTALTAANAKRMADTLYEFACSYFMTGRPFTFTQLFGLHSECNATRYERNSGYSPKACAEIRDAFHAHVKERTEPTFEHLMVNVHTADDVPLYSAEYVTVVAAAQLP